jgi:hypothetical protein
MEQRKRPMVQERALEVRAEYDAEAHVWVATSDDVPGLVTEADDLDALRAKLPTMARELIELDNVGPADAPGRLALNSSDKRVQHGSK